MAKRAVRRGKITGVEEDPATRNFRRGLTLLHSGLLFSPMLARAGIARHEGSLCKKGWAVVTSNGVIHVHPTCRAEPEEWVYVLAHCLLHLAFDHFHAREKPYVWNVACDAFVARFLTDLKIGSPPAELRDAGELQAHDEESLYEQLCASGVPEPLRGLGTAGALEPDMIVEPRRPSWWGQETNWQEAFGRGLSLAVASAVNVAAGREPFVASHEQKLSPAQRAKSWFISHFPLLGALAASFAVVEDPVVCGRLDISVAAVDPESQEIFINPAAGLTEAQCRFVMAHELLHVGLAHHARADGRDPFLWNVSADFVINGWLIQMGIGEPPQMGLLHDAELQGYSAESIYDRIVTDLRRARKLATLRGAGAGDILSRGRPDWWAGGEGLDLDAFYRGALSRGLAYHEERERGYLPAGLIEEIRALRQPPIAWDVQLAQWFDERFPPLEKIRSYARPSRRQSATPEIPLPRWVPPYAAGEGRTFGVLLDTSGSMDRELLARALGSIATYSMSRDVLAVRIVFCDAAHYDQGYMAPEEIAGKVKVKGRGGTVLQPAIDMLEEADDFPKDAPLLIITDGFCDKLQVKREHAYLIPAGRSLPFVPKGKVFRMKG